MLRKHIFPVIGFAAALFFVQALSPQDTTDPSARDRKFVRSVLEGGNAEVALGKLAVQKSSSQDVKQLGQKMMADHAQLTEQMRDVAKKEHIRAHVGTASKDKAVEARLKRLSGATFDRAYLAATVKDQRQDLDEFNREANDGNDTAIKRAASRGALVIGEQLEQAKQTARNHDLPLVR